MKKLWGLAQIVFFGALIVGLVSLFSMVGNGGASNFLSIMSSPESSSSFPQNTASVGYPPPATSTLPSLTVEPTTEPTIEFNGTIPPPPNWPTDQPWPPATLGPLPSSTPSLFSTPVYSPSPIGEATDHLYKVWYPYLSDSHSAPEFSLVSIDSQGQRWNETKTIVNFTTQAMPDTTSLQGLYLSPNHKWIVADVAFQGTFLIDIEKGTAGPIIADVNVGPGYFLSWTPDGQRAVVIPSMPTLQVWVLDIDRQKYVTLDYSQVEKESGQIQAIAYSPDAKYIADIVVYPPVYGGRSNWVMEIGLREGEDGNRLAVAKIDNGSKGNLNWSPDSRRLTWVANVILGKAHSESQLWMMNLDTSDPVQISVLGMDVEYRHSAVWSPDGKSIAFLKVKEVYEGKDGVNGLYTINPDSGIERLVAQYPSTFLSHVSWSPDGSWLAFTLSRGDYGEIWVTNPDGTQQHPIAGPTTSDAPFVLLP